MPERNSHIILRQVLDLSLPKGKDAFALQQEVGLLARDRLAPALESLFDRFAPPEELVRIDRLEIDLGTFSLTPSGETFVDAATRALEEKLLSMVTYSQAEINKGSPGAGQFDQWLFFLEKGHLPWNASIGKETDLHRAVLKQARIDPAASGKLLRLIREYPTALARLVGQHPETFLVKLLTAISGRSQAKLPAYLSETWQLTLELKKLHNWIASPGDIKLFLRSFWDWAFRSVSKNTSYNKDANSLILNFINSRLLHQSNDDARGESRLRYDLVNLIRSEAANFPLLYKLTGKIKNPVPVLSVEDTQTLQGKPLKKKDAKVQETPGFQAAEEGQVQASTKVDTSTASQPDKISPTVHPQKETGDSLTDHEKSLNPGQDEAADSSSVIPEIKMKEHDEYQDNKLPGNDKAKGRGKDKISSSGDREIKEIDYPEGSSWYVHYAGIVLLHTFFVPYFEKCGLVKKGSFINAECRNKAVHLLQYLASGETGLPEYELLLPKFLCGVPFEEPIEREMIITEIEKTESLDLLRAAIGHWGKLGKSSPDALREGFLQREGKLEKRQQGWYLTVEQKSIDILLDFLPWNLRMVKLPWMNELLRVEWG